MAQSLEIRVHVHPKKLSRASILACKKLESYDWILFSSKHAVTFFIQELKKLKVSFPKKLKVGAVGTVTATMLKKYNIRVHLVPKDESVDGLVKHMKYPRGTHILFPRSAIAPYDVIRTLRGRGAVVRIIPLYTTAVVPLTAIERKKLLMGDYTSLTFKSPSGVRGLRSQLSKEELATVKNIKASCIGTTTASAAKAVGFKKITII